MTWRKLEAADLEAIEGLADRIHPSLPEDSAVFQERVRLYPEGCLVCEDQGRLAGYAVTHPWMRDQVPALNARLGTLPAGCDTYYFHDVALAPEVRGHRLGSEAVERLKTHAFRSGFHTAHLVAVYASGRFWERHGFRRKDVPTIRQKLATYGAEAIYMECALGRPAA